MVLMTTFRIIWKELNRCNLGFSCTYNLHALCKNCKLLDAGSHGALESETLRTKVTSAGLYHTLNAAVRTPFNRNFVQLDVQTLLFGFGMMGQRLGRTSQFHWWLSALTRVGYITEQKNSFSFQEKNWGDRHDFLELTKQKNVLTRSD